MPPTVFPLTYSAITTVDVMPTIDTTALFAPASGKPMSPIDRYLGNTNEINRLCLPYADGSAGPFPPELGALAILGYMSAVESYMRSMITGLIAIDHVTRKTVESKTLTFAAAMQENRKQVPEALLEDLSFASSDIVKKGLESFIGIKKLPNDVQSALAIFGKVCTLRHCCVHRFGKLGTRNALDLGFDEHKHCIEHPFTPRLEDVLTIADSLRITVKTINNFVFAAVLDRSVEPPANSGLLGVATSWKWSYKADRKRFGEYYALFSVASEAPASPKPKDVYRSFLSHHAPRLRKQGLLPQPVARAGRPKGAARTK